MTTNAQSRRSASPSAVVPPTDCGFPSAPSSKEASQIFIVSDRRASLATRATLGISRELWRDRAEIWAQEGSSALSKVADAVIAESGELMGQVAVDLGCGSGQLTFQLACLCTQVLAVDIDAGAIDLLRTRAGREGLTNIEAIIHPLETLELPPASVDLIVSNYAMHHLRDADKRQLLERSFTWLRPGGRLVIGDMMFGRGMASDDREIIRQKVSILVGRGPAGWWRILKNAFRFLVRFQEKPLRPTVWQSMVLAAGFENVRAFHVAAEAHVVSTTKPPIKAHGQ
jgi:ubiquinone/menaquinone biosynthesis C-methylase UbiE